MNTEVQISHLESDFCASLKRLLFSVAAAFLSNGRSGKHEMIAHCSLDTYSVDYY